MKIYIIMLVKKWYIYLGLLPIFYDFISAYFALDFHFSNETTLLIIILTLLYSSYRVWKDENLEKQKVLSKLVTKDKINLLNENIDEIVSLLSMPYSNDFDKKLEIKLNFIISDLELILKLNILEIDEYLSNIIQMRLNELIENLKNKEYKKAVGHDYNGIISEADFEVKNKYFIYIDKIESLLKK